MTNPSKYSLELERELRETASPAEVASLLSLANGLSRAGQPTRSKATHKATWRAVSGYIAAGRSPWYRLNWKFALIPAGAIAAVAGVVFFSQNALPGDVTYSVKRASENVQLAVAISDAKKAGICSVQMKLRANELARLPEDRLSTTTVSELTASILEEAKEFEEYASKSGNNAAALQQQRIRDARYVVEALDTAKKHTTDEQQLKAIEDARSAMQAIVPAA